MFRVRRDGAESHLHKLNEQVEAKVDEKKKRDLMEFKSALSKVLSKLFRECVEMSQSNTY